MSKKVFKLEITNDTDFLLAGIICSYKDYRLCFELNDVLKWQLKRKKDHTVYLGKPGAVAVFSHYSFTNKFGEEFFVLSNKSTNGILLPEKTAFDYLIMIRNVGAYFAFAEFLQKLKSIEMISAVNEIFPEQLKSCDNLLID